MKKLEKLQNTLGNLLEMAQMLVFIIILAVALVVTKIQELFS